MKCMHQTRQLGGAYCSLHQRPILSEDFECYQQCKSFTHQDGTLAEEQEILQRLEEKNKQIEHEYQLISQQEAHRWKYQQMAERVDKAEHLLAIVITTIQDLKHLLHEKTAGDDSYFFRDGSSDDPNEQP